MSEEPDAVDALYLDAEHFVLTAESGGSLEPRAHITSVGRPFSGLLPGVAPVRPDEEPT